MPAGLAELSLSIAGVVPEADPFTSVSTATTEVVSVAPELSFDVTSPSCATGQ
jgi:hypothetical protein